MSDPKTAPGVEWNMIEAPYLRGPWVPDGLTDAERQFIAERLTIYAGLFDGHTDDITEEYVRELAAKAKGGAS